MKKNQSKRFANRMPRVRTWVLLLVVCGSIGRCEEKRPDYVHPQLLVGPDALVQPTSASQFVILDARNQGAFAQEHIPKARWVNAAEWATAFGDGQDEEEWSSRIGGLGIGPDMKVLVYDDSRTKDAARVWWILRYWGVEDVRLLNGG